MVDALGNLVDFVLLAGQRHIGFLAQWSVTRKFSGMDVGRGDACVANCQTAGLYVRNLRGDATVALFAYLTGWRKGEIIGLQWATVNRSAAVIRLEPAQTKNRTVRVLALQGEMAALIGRRWKARKAGRTLARHVFHRGGEQLTEFRRPWLAARRQAGLGNRMFHSLRRTAARDMCLQGIPEKVIMSIMGHKTRGMFDRHNIVTEADQRVYMERLSGFIRGK